MKCTVDCEYFVLQVRKFCIFASRPLPYRPTCTIAQSKISYFSWFTLTVKTFQSKSECSLDSMYMYMYKTLVCQNRYYTAAIILPFADVCSTT